MRPQFCWPALLVVVVLMHSPGNARVSSGSPPPTVTLKAGTFEGTHFGALQNEVAFLGVPYAAPPIGGLRWKPPRPPVEGAGIRKAVRFGAACPQLPAGWLPYPVWSEDCLFLNIWTTQLVKTAKLPVIVYFHGGSNRAGYSQLTPLGPTLSRMGVVVVTANYRLGPFGFLAHPALTSESEHHSSGNYGLLDQIQALKWVRENISHFGGDPGRITVMGQSAGAVDICLLMASRLATGLFRRAIMESGDCQSTLNEDIRTSLSYNGISGTGESAGERLAEDLGVGNGPDTLQRLRDIPADSILEAWSQDRQAQFDAIVDGWVIAEQPAKIFAKGRQARVAVLVGSNADEATVFGHNELKTVDQYKTFLQGDTGEFADEEFQIYPVTHDTDIPARYLQLQNDSFGYGAYSMARSMARVGQKSFLYLFTYAETGKRATLGAYHGEELAFLSNSFSNDWEHGRDDERLGKTMRLYWTDFAKTGSPNAPGLPNWVANDAEREQRFVLGRSVEVQPIGPRVLALGRIMQQIVAKAEKTR
jgi:para-nitrobenzyl esterase